MSNRVKSLKFQSPIGASGRPRYFLPGVPTRDLDEDDINLLSSEEYETVKAAKMPDGQPLYQAPKPPPAKSSKATSGRGKTSKAPKAAPPAPAGGAGEAPTGNEEAAETTEGAPEGGAED